VSDGLLMNLAAIENSDHMTSPHADKYDFDGWYRARITALIKVIREQHTDQAGQEQASHHRPAEFELAYFVAYAHEGGFRMHRVLAENPDRILCRR
jgi:hypothetical protein